jgi:hypothetical protein
MSTFKTFDVPLVAGTTKGVAILHYEVPGSCDFQDIITHVSTYDPVSTANTRVKIDGVYYYGIEIPKLIFNNDYEALEPKCVIGDQPTFVVSDDAPLLDPMPS